MSEGTSNNGAKSVYPAELWPEARSLYEGGLSLQGVAEKLGMPYSTVRHHAWTEDWECGRGVGSRTLGIKQIRAGKRVGSACPRLDRNCSPGLMITSTASG